MFMIDDLAKLSTSWSTSCWKSAKICVICVIRVLKMTSHSEDMINVVRSCELKRFIRGLLLSPFLVYY